jgi:hypothetical protein
MTDDELERSTIAVGHWRYAEDHDEAVRIVGLSFDYWFSVGEADGQLDLDEQAQPLGDQGLLYYPYFAQIDGPGFPTVIQAKGYAQSKIRVPIRWD